MTATKSSPLPRSKVRGSGDTPKVGMFSAEWCTGPQIHLGGSDYWRLALPAAKLYENGWDVKFARNLASAQDGRLAIQTTDGEWLSDRDIVVIQRWMGEGTAERIQAARATGQIIVNEVDDDYWNFPESHISRKTSDPAVNPTVNRKHYRENIEASSLVTVSTRYLENQISSWGPTVKLIHNYIDSRFWTYQSSGDFVGWVGGLPWRGNDLEILGESVVPWLRARKQFFYHGGAVAGHSLEDRLGYERITTRPLCSLPDYPKLWEPLHVALVPLENTLFNQAKSWIKGLEAGARGIPFIHSAHPEYAELGIGLCAHTPEEWVEHLEALEDPEFYKLQSDANHEKAEALDIDNHWSEWADVLLEAVPS